ncbi:hypothetical protein D3C81_1439670 [compost metagenome]
MIGRPDHVNPKRLQARLRRHDRVGVGNLKREVLDPVAHLRVPDVARRERGFEKGNATPVFHFEEDVDVRVELLGRRHALRAHHMAQFQAQDLRVERRGFLGVLASVGRVAQLSA